jgi:hypothetical protein
MHLRPSAKSVDNLSRQKNFLLAFRPSASNRIVEGRIWLAGARRMSVRTVAAGLKLGGSPGDIDKKEQRTKQMPTTALLQRDALGGDEGRRECYSANETF